MSFGKFFKDALLPVAVWTCGVLLSCFVLTVAGAPISIVVVAVGVSFIFGMLGIVIEYARRRRFLRQLERAAGARVPHGCRRWCNVRPMPRASSSTRSCAGWAKLPATRLPKAAVRPMIIVTISRAGSTRPSCRWRRPI
ncbi:MAG: hypothetical protein ACLTYW_03880 [Collinsella sp.]